MLKVMLCFFFKLKVLIFHVSLIFIHGQFIVFISMIQEFHFFQSQESSITQKSELNMYLDEPRLEWNSNMDVLSFWNS